LWLIKGPTQSRNFLHHQFEQAQCLGYELSVALPVRGKHLIAVEKVISNLTEMFEKLLRVYGWTWRIAEDCFSTLYNQLLGRISGNPFG
jgi:hypothetical protein